MSTGPKPPKAYEAFQRRYPQLGKAWSTMAEAGREGPLDPKAVRLVKLALSVGAMREGAVHSNIRKALALGLEPEAIYQVVALAASTLGMPATVAAFTWTQDILGEKPE